MSALQTTTLAECEAIIERGLTSFVEVGQALKRIRDEGLYRGTHKTFDDYCRERWGLSRSYAHRQIDAAQVVAMLPIGNVPPSEAVARELVPLKVHPSRLTRVWQEVVEVHGEKPTALATRRMVGIKRDAVPDGRPLPDWVYREAAEHNVRPEDWGRAVLALSDDDDQRAGPTRLTKAAERRAIALMVHFFGAGVVMKTISDKELGEVVARFGGDEVDRALRNTRREVSRLLARVRAMRLPAGDGAA